MRPIGAADRLADIRHWTRIWPAAEVVETDGWLLQATDGFTKRANAALRLDAAAEVDTVEAFYRPRGLPLSVVDYAGLGDRFAEQLIDRGWRALPFDPVMTRPLSSAGPAVLPDGYVGGVEVGVPGERWFRGWFASGRDDSAAARALVGRSPWQAFALIDDGAGGLPAAVGRVAVSGRWAGVNCMWTRPDRRGRGLAGAVLEMLAARAREVGARQLQLSVEHDNTAALAAYAKAGFSRVDRYRYLFAPDELFGTAPAESSVPPRLP